MGGFEGVDVGGTNEVPYGVLVLGGIEGVGSTPGIVDDDGGWFGVKEGVGAWVAVVVGGNPVGGAKDPL